MANTAVTLKAFLEERHLTQKDTSFFQTQVRDRIERSPLLEIMRDTCTAINKEAGRVVVEGHHYLAPEPVICSFTFIKGDTEFVMRVELADPKPRLVFVTRRWRNTSSNGFVRWIYRLAEVEPLSVNVKFNCELPFDDISEQEVQQWFFYLLSGLSRTYTPSFQHRKYPALSGELE